MSGDAVLAVVVTVTAVLLALIVLAPWRAVRRERPVADDDYYTLLGGGEPRTESGATGDRSPGEASPGGEAG